MSKTNIMIVIYNEGYAIGGITLSIDDLFSVRPKVK